ncbi:hypothetical protein NLJ89_g2178 [Agrocybe chaxingu]|uniref:Uncharacterized protein n=1 Tax=Agrocybe chaxingu TaxID=84603 RepID=A0A9W8K741_9AGAR|nr:hypothetical protein NLJ89_g2178 [Agrocybe chaxingu]
MWVWVALFGSTLGVSGHVAAWHKGMYCLNGTTPGVDDGNTNAAVQPLYQLEESEWWFHHVNECDMFPPTKGDFLELPANGEFTVELAVNRAFTTLSYNGANTAIFGDGRDHPGLGVTRDGKADGDACISDPNIHTQNETMAAGTIFAISYVSDLTQVTKENLVVFTALYHTPWRRLATYKVPNLPACPEEGCICAWGDTGDAAVAPGKPPVWCEDEPGRCVQGAKQMVFWNQLEGNNVQVSGVDLAGEPKAPTYNMRMGFADGPQNDIFAERGSANPTFIAPAPTPTLSGSAWSKTRGISTVFLVLAVLLLQIRL